MKRNVVTIAVIVTLAFAGVAFMVGRKYVADKASSASKYTISKQKAVDYIKAWRKHEEASGKKRGEYVEAFNMDASEWQDIMKELTTISNGDISKMGVRLYMGLNDEGKQTLVIVATDSDGNDVTFYRDEQGKLQSGIYDFTRPCPGTCDEVKGLRQE